MNWVPVDLQMAYLPSQEALQYDVRSYIGRHIQQLNFDGLGSLDFVCLFKFIQDFVADGPDLESHLAEKRILKYGVKYLSLLFPLLAFTEDQAGAEGPQERAQKDRLLGVEVDVVDRKETFLEIQVDQIDQNFI